MQFFFRTRKNTPVLKTDISNVLKVGGNLLLILIRSTPVPNPFANLQIRNVFTEIARRRKIAFVKTGGKVSIAIFASKIQVAKMGIAIVRLSVIVIMDGLESIVILVRISIKKGVSYQ